MRKAYLGNGCYKGKDSSILNRLNLEDLKQLSTLFACTEEQILGAAEGRFS